MPQFQHSQAGMMLIEVLVSILIFAVAVLGLVGLQGNVIRTVRDSDYRARASFFADQIVGQMWVDRFNVPTYTLNANAPNACAAGANASANPAVTSWLSDLSNAANPGALPGAGNLQQQIIIGANNVVTVVLCWQSPQDTAPHSFTLNAQIQG